MRTAGVSLGHITHMSMNAAKKSYASKELHVRRPCSGACQLVTCTNKWHVSFSQPVKNKLRETNHHILKFSSPLFSR
jgi:hypothetical protein